MANDFEIRRRDLQRLQTIKEKRKLTEEGINNYYPSEPEVLAANPTIARKRDEALARARSVLGPIDAETASLEKKLNLPQGIDLGGIEQTLKTEAEQDLNRRREALRQKDASYGISRKAPTTEGTVEIEDNSQMTMPLSEQEKLRQQQQSQGPTLVPVTNSSTTRQVTSGPLSREEAGGLLTEYQEAQQAELGTAALSEASKAQAAKDQSAALQEAQSQTRGMSDELAQDATRMKAQYTQAEKDAQEDSRRYKELSAKGIDPNRLWNNASATQKFITKLSVGLGAFAEAFSHGKVQNDALQMLEKSIDRDIAAQNEDLRNALSQAEMSNRQKADIWNRYSQTFDSRRLALAQATQTKLDLIAKEQEARDAKAGLGAATLAARFRRDNVDKRESLLKASAQQTTTSSTTQKEYVKMDPGKNGAPGSEPPPNPVITEVGNLLSTQENLRDMYKKFKRLSALHGAEKHWPMGEAENWHKFTSLFERSVARMIAQEKGSMSDTDAKLSKEILAGNWDSNQDVKKRVGLAMSLIGKITENKIKAHRQYYNMTPLIEQYNEVQTTWRDIDKATPAQRVLMQKGVKQ